MDRTVLTIIIVLLIIGLKFFFARSKVSAWIVGCVLILSLFYETYQGADVLFKNPLYILYGLLATMIANAFSAILSLADKKNKITPFIKKDSPLANPFFKWTTLFVLLLLQIHLYAFILYNSIGKHLGKGALVIPLLLSFISSILLMTIYRNVRKTHQ